MQNFDEGVAANANQANMQFVQPCTPWNLDTMPWKLATTSAPQPNGVMQFGPMQMSAPQIMPPAAYGHNNPPNVTKWIQKRKSEEQWSMPYKQHITEERITAHFSGLHISGGSGRSDYKYHQAQQQQHHIGIDTAHNNTNRSSTNSMIQGGLPSDDMPSTSSGKTDSFLANPAYQLAAQELGNKLRNASRIVLCDQVKQLDDVRQKCTVIPEILLKTISRPCTALIPWQPPPIDTKLLCHQADSGMKLNPRSQEVLKGAMMNDDVIDDDELLDDYVDVDDGISGYMDNNNTCNINLNKSDEAAMDEDLDL